MTDLTYLPNLSNEDYHALPHVSPSRLKLLARSPLHYFDTYLAVDREKPEPTAAMKLGTATHTAILEPELFEATVKELPADAPRRPTQLQLEEPAKTGTAKYRDYLDALERKQYWDEFDKKNAGKIILPPTDFDNVQSMADAVRKHPAAKFLLDLPGRREASYTWTGQHGIQCKTRPDWHSLCHEYVIDLKSTRDASRDEFARSLAGYDYHLQAAWNLSALSARKFLIIAVESTRPFAVAVYPVSDATIAAGNRRVNSAMALLANCLATNNWPGYGDMIHYPIDLPAWCKD
jgi:exodeoxyribonuclease VIII